MFLRSIKLDGLLSFAPGTEAFELQPLNVVIGPNGSGKSNLIEAIELLKALPTSLSSAIREGGGIGEWLWKDGTGLPRATPRMASVEAVFSRARGDALRYRLDFSRKDDRAEVLSEKLDDATVSGESAPFHFRFSGGVGELTSSSGPNSSIIRLQHLNANESIFAQRKDPDRYPELSWLSAKFSGIQTFREWRFGRQAPVRQLQPVDLPSETLSSDSANLALLIERILKDDAGRQLLEAALRRFLPRFEGFSIIRIENFIQLAIREASATTPAARLSDGTLRFLALAVLLLQPEPPPLICIEEPELGLHPDALSIIAELLVEASTRTQLIVTTHSDALVSALSAHVESIVVCEHRGGTVLSRLEAERLSHWLERYRLGDLWRMGELGGNP